MYKYKILNTDKLSEYKNNSRTHSEDQIKQIANSINEFGFTNPLLINDKQTIIAGHGRLSAALSLGMDKIPCIIVTDLTNDQEKALILADNQLALNAGWSLDILKSEISELKLNDFDIELLGFDDDFMVDLLNNVETVEFPVLADGDKEPFQQMTFTMHDDQAAIVIDAVTLARTNPLSDTGINDNTNGNAISLICRQWLGAQDGVS